MVYGSHPVPLTPKIELPTSPIQMSQKDINDILTTIAATPSTPLIGGYGQPELTSQDFQCSIYGNVGHILEYYNNSSLQQTTNCFYCGESGHTIKQCSYRGYSPTIFDTPAIEAMSVISETSPVQPARSPVQPFALSLTNTSTAKTALLIIRIRSSLISLLSSLMSLSYLPRHLIHHISRKSAMSVPCHP